MLIRCVSEIQTSLGRLGFHLLNLTPLRDRWPRQAPLSEARALGPATPWPRSQTPAPEGMSPPGARAHTLALRLLRWLGAGGHETHGSSANTGLAETHGSRADTGLARALLGNLSAGLPCGVMGWSRAPSRIAGSFAPSPQSASRDGLPGNTPLHLARISGSASGEHTARQGSDRGRTVGAAVGQWAAVALL